MTDVTTTISTSGLALRTPQEANIGLAVIHGTTATWPNNYSAFSANLLIPNPVIAPTVTLAPDMYSSWLAATYSISYAWSVNGSLANPGLTTMPSPATTIVVPSSSASLFQLSAPGPIPLNATRVAWYVGVVNPVTGMVTRTFNFAATALTASDDGSYWNDISAEPTVNTTALTELSFGRADDENGNTPVPIPQATPTTSYSWYKSIQAVISVNGQGNTNVTNIAICQLSKPAPGISVFYRVVSGYVRCNGSPGLPTDSTGAQTGNYPPDDLTPYTGKAPNTPAGYTPLPTTPVIIANGPYFTGTAGPIGPVVQLVLGLTDRTAMTQAGGQLALPAIALYYDET